jgi:hypothetical protein
LLLFWHCLVELLQSLADFDAEPQLSHHLETGAVLSWATSEIPELDIDAEL